MKLNYPTPGLIFVSLLIFVCLHIQAYAQHTLSIDASSIINDVATKPVGINVNYLMDGSYLNPAPVQSTQDALKSMGVKFLRYPGGEKSDNYLWSVSPWTSSQPRVARTGAEEWPSGDSRFTLADQATLQSHVLDFDEFMAMCKAIGAEPVIVVAYDGIYKPAALAGASIPTREQLLKNAEEWVRYANVVKKYGIKYWMVGNESYHACEYNGCATASQYRDDVVDFSKRMKAIDPGIKIIANGNSTSWWATVLPTAAIHIDYLGLSNYPVWNFTGGYDYYRTNTPGFMSAVETAINAIQTYAPSNERSRIKIITTEYNAMDWSGSWADKNDLGHALVSFEILGEHLKNPAIALAHFWNTRWVENATTPYHIYDAIDKNGSLQANGKSLAIWGNYLLQKMVQTTSTRAVRSFATIDAASQKLNIFLINKETTSQSVQLTLQNFVQSYTGKRWEFSGTGPGDTAPAFNYKTSLNGSGSQLALTLPAVSITVLELTGNSAEICDGKDNNGDGQVDEGCTACTASGKILREVWTNKTGYQVSAIPVNTTPNITSQLTIFEAPTNFGSNYGQRIRGYICPPLTGSYTFYIAGDDNCELWLSTDDTPAKKARIAHITGSSVWAGVRNWSKYTSQKSASIPLVAGRRYYIEALHKESMYGDNLAVGWKLPNGTLERPVPGSRLSPFVPETARVDFELTAEPEMNQPFLQVSGNPSTGEKLHVKVQGLASGEEVIITLYSSVGNKVISEKAIANEKGLLQQLNFAAGLAPGMYTLVLQNRKNLLIEKLIVSGE